MSEHVTPEYQQQLDSLAQHLTERFRKPTEATLYFSGVCQPELVADMAGQLTESLEA